MSSKSGCPTTDIRVVGAKKLQNGSIVYELNNLESAQWVRKEKAEFAKHYGETVIIKDKSVSIIVEYVPLPITLMHWAKAGKSNKKQESLQNQ